MIIDPSDPSLQQNLLYFCFCCGLLPIGWILAILVTGTNKLAPFSYFTGVLDRLPVIAVSIAYQRALPYKEDTLKNIETRGSFHVICVPNSNVKKMKFISANESLKDDEFSHATLTPIPCTKTTFPCVKESPSTVECKVLQTIPISQEESGSSTPILGEVVLIHLHEATLDGDAINVKKLDTLSCLDINFIRNYRNFLMNECYTFFNF